MHVYVEYLYMQKGDVAIMKEKFLFQSGGNLFTVKNNELKDLGKVPENEREQEKLLKSYGIEKISRIAPFIDKLPESGFIIFSK